MEITECEGYKKLIAAVEHDEKQSAGFHDYRGRLAWIVDRANHYAEITGLDASAVLDAWERSRTYWYMNYYQDCNQPHLDSERVKVFKTQEELLQSIGHQGFRCPRCGGVSKSPYECDSGQEMEKGKICDWKVWGLFHDLGKGVFVFCNDKMAGERIFMPLAWEVVKED
jgi:hypothetical protein